MKRPTGFMIILVMAAMVLIHSQGSQSLGVIVQSETGKNGLDKIGANVQAPLPSLSSQQTSPLSDGPVIFGGPANPLRKPSAVCKGVQIGDFSGFDWTNGEAYAAFGQVYIQNARPTLSLPGGFSQSVLVSDPFNQILFQSAGPIGGSQWVFANGTYFYSSSIHGVGTCFYNPSVSYQQEVENYQESVYLSNVVECVNTPSCKQYLYSGNLVNSSVSCQEPMMVALSVDAFNRVTGMNTLFTFEEQDSSLFYKTLQSRGIFAYQSFTNHNVLSHVPSLPSDCFDQALPLCDSFFPHGAFSY